MNTHKQVSFVKKDVVLMKSALKTNYCLGFTFLGDSLSLEGKSASLKSDSEQNRFHS